MIIIGIDPGSIVTGYGIIEVRERQCHPVDFGCIRLPVSYPLEQRYLLLFEGIDQLLMKYSPQALVVETQFVSKNVQSAIKLGMARGMAILGAAKRNIPVHEYAPTKAKKAVVGMGRASKSQVQGMIKLLLNLPQLPEPEDAADALALAICHSHTLGVHNV